MKLSNLTGQKFGRLLVINHAENNGKIKSLWKCKCDCGKEITATSRQLRDGKKSCGCLSAVIGKRYGKLVVIERAENKNKGRIQWKCKCDCGKEVIVATTALKLGRTRSCGCLKVKDLIGNRYGRLVVIERAENNKQDEVCWRCKCDCGKEKIISRRSLDTGRSQSCGCYHKEVISKPPGEASLNKLIGDYKRRAEKSKLEAKKSKIEYTLSDDEFKDLILADCYYCGKEPSQQQSKTRLNGNLIYNGIDRIDNSKGYVQGNVRTCCGKCNLAKKDYTEEEFELWIKAIYEHLKLS